MFTVSARWFVMALVAAGWAPARPAGSNASGSAEGAGGARGTEADEATPAVARKPFSLLAPLPGEVVPPRENEYQLRRTDDGSGDLLYQASAFEARIHRDGSVSFHDKSIASSLFLPWLPMQVGPRGPTLQGVLSKFVGLPDTLSGPPVPTGGTSAILSLSPAPPPRHARSFRL